MDQEKFYYKNVLLKISGEFLETNDKTSLHLDKIIQNINELTKKSVKVSIVVGGGNILRGASSKRIKDRVVADHIGMLATMINAITLEEILKKNGIKAVSLASVKCDKFIEEYTYKKGKKYLEDGYVIIFSAGTGNPYFTTDTSAVLKAIEMKAEILFKATKVNGVFDKDPKKYKDAKKIDKITYNEYLEKNLQVMDQSAISLAKENILPIRIFDFFEDGSLLKATNNEKIGSYIFKE